VHDSIWRSSLVDLAPTASQPEKEAEVACPEEIDRLFTSSDWLPMIDVSVANTYEEPRAHAVRKRYLDIIGGPELPVPVEAIAEDHFGLPVEKDRDLGDWSRMLLPTGRRTPPNAAEAKHQDVAVRPTVRGFKLKVGRTLVR
jgi:hypothetical protein